MSKLTAATADEGYFLHPAPLANPADSDTVYQRILSAYLPQDLLTKVQPGLQRFGSEAISEQVHDWARNAESQPPFVKSRTVWGTRPEKDRLVTANGWKQVGKWGLENGVVAHGYEAEFGQYRRIVQHAFNYIYSAASATYSCPVSMTSGACRLVRFQLDTVPKDHPFHYLYAKLTARENPWISAQWMTERAGGSDVRNSETIAVYSPLSSKTGRFGSMDEGDYLLSGFKFFASAADCNVAFILAKTDSGQISMFVAPTVKTVRDGNGQERKVTNGIRIHRLKQKFGTKELPTAEMELKDVRAHMIGPKDRGIATIALLLNVTRTHNSITALSCLRRAMEIAKCFARSRKTLNQPLWTFPMHLHTLAQLEVKHRGWMQLAFFTTSLLGYTDYGFPSSLPGHYTLLSKSPPLATIVLRALTSTSKAVICKSSTLAFQECQEAMGGVGYMDEPEEPESNVSRLWRDTASNAVWEGTSNVLASETVRHLTRGDNLKAFGNWVHDAISCLHDPYRLTLQSAWEALYAKLDHIAAPGGLANVLAEGRQIMFTLAWLISGILLGLDAERDGEPTAHEVARRWILKGEGIPGEFTFPAITHSFLRVAPRAEASKGRDTHRTNWDCRIVWGVDLPEGAASGFRSMAKI